MKKAKANSNNGITLIALVITIIVLLILATVSIATLTGENGILTKANDAKTNNTIGEEKEQIGLAYNAVMADNKGSEVTADKLQDELQKYDSEITVADEGEKFKVTFPNGHVYTVNKNGTIDDSAVGGTTTPPTGKSSLEQAKEDGRIFVKKETVEDEYGNKVVVPENFKIADDSATDVTGGVVIEDASEKPTKGSQFVWIPVGDVKKGTETKTITLSRYRFADGENDKGSDGNNLEKGTPIEQGQTAINSNYASNEHTENLEGKGNAVADEEVYNAFVNKTEDENKKTKVEKAGGYYIGRYEARKNGTQITEKANDSVYMCAEQPQASKLCQGMYTGKTFKSDLMNSYAWDTAIVYLQTFDNREEKVTPYSYQTSLNSSFEAKGTNNIEQEGSNPDKICNVWDMASNCLEWTTEASDHLNRCCTTRGGGWYSSTSATGSRWAEWTTDDYGHVSFRPLLVVNV